MDIRVEKGLEQYVICCGSIFGPYYNTNAKHDCNIY